MAIRRLIIHSPINNETSHAGSPVHYFFFFGSRACVFDALATYPSSVAAAISSALLTCCASRCFCLQTAILLPGAHQRNLIHRQGRYMGSRGCRVRVAARAHPVRVSISAPRRMCRVAIRSLNSSCCPWHYDCIARSATFFYLRSLPDNNALPPPPSASLIHNSAAHATSRMTSSHARHRNRLPNNIIADASIHYHRPLR